MKPGGVSGLIGDVHGLYKAPNFFGLPATFSLEKLICWPLNRGKAVNNTLEHQNGGRDCLIEAAVE